MQRTSSMLLPTVCLLLASLIATLPAATQKKQERPKPPLEFSLYDTQGRLVKSEDYKGAPVLVEFGACW